MKRPMDTRPATSGVILKSQTWNFGEAKLMKIILSIWIMLVGSFMRDGEMRQYTRLHWDYSKTRVKSIGSFFFSLSELFFFPTAILIGYN